MKLEPIEIPVDMRFRRPWLIKLLPLAIPLGVVSCRIMARCMRAMLALACLECRIDGGQWAPAEVEFEINCDDDDDDSGGGDWLPSYAGATL